MEKKETKSPSPRGEGPGVRGKIQTYLQKPKRKIASDLIFWIFLLLLVIPSTRAKILGGVSKLRTAVFAPALKASDGPVLTEADWNWPLIGIDGTSTRLGEFKTEFLIINSWATWCPPCRAEMPSLEKLYKNYKDRVSFLLVTSEEAAVVEEFLQSKAYTFPVFLAPNGTPQSLSSRSIPATFIINRTGQIVFQKTGAFDWNSKKVHQFLDAQLAQ